MKGALVSFASTFGLSLPNVIIFQFNPETLRHTLTQTPPSATGSNPLAAPGNPGESFSFTLSMEATDQLADGNPIVMATGIYARLAALEMLLFPSSSSSGLASVLPTSGEQRDVPAAQVPAVLFVWGPGRIVPVRVTSLTVTEKIFDSLLNPTHAEVSIELKVLTPSELAAITGPLKDVANAAYSYTQVKRSALALANLANAAEALELPAIPGI